MKHNRNPGRPHMHLLDIIRIAVRMLRTNLLRSLLTILGIGVAITFIVILMGLGYGLQTITIGSIVHSKALLSIDIKADSKQNSALTPQTITTVQQLPGVTAVTPVINTDGTARIAGQAATVTLAAGNEHFLEMEGIEVRSGHAYKADAREVVMAPEALSLLNLTAEEVIGKPIVVSYTDPNNQNVLLNLDNLVVVGVSATADGPIVYLPITLLNPDGKTRLTLVKATATDRETVLKVRDALTGQGYTVETLVETLDQARKVFRWVTLALATFGTIALLVASIGMFNTLTIALIERTREIGIMKAIGVTDDSIRHLFLAEAGIIGLFGGLTGISVAIIINTIINFAVNQVAANYQAPAVQLFAYPPGFLIAMVVFPIILSMLTGLYPAIRASRLNPLRALRYE